VFVTYTMIHITVVVLLFTQLQSSYTKSLASGVVVMLKETLLSV